MVFLLLLELVPLPELIMALNGVFMGALAAIVVAYGRLLWNAMLGVRPYDRVRQMTIGFALMWAAYAIAVFISIYFRSSAMEINTTLWTAFHRYLAIIAAMLQVSAPDFGLGLFHGRDRKTLWSGVVVGLMVAIFVMAAQTFEILALDGWLSAKLDWAMNTPAYFRRA